MAKPIYKKIANKPLYQSYGQYSTLIDTPLVDIWDNAGLTSPFSDDDLYTTVTDGESITLGSGQLNFPGSWPTIGNNLLFPNYIFKKWRPVSNVYVGNKYNMTEGTYLQQYYKFDNPEYFRTSAPNIAHIYFDFHEDDNTYDFEGTGNYWDMLLDFYKESDNSITLDMIKSAPEYIKQKPRLKILNWDWKKGDNETGNPIEYTSTADGGFLIDDDGEPVVYSHQYDSPGVKIIKALIYTNCNNNESNPTISFYYSRGVTITLNMGLDDIYIDDFTTLGGPDFVYLPWPYTTPIIGGISEDSKYYSSVRRLVKKNPFSSDEAFDKYMAQKSYYNDEFGKSLPDLDLQQFRMFKGGGFDMNYILGINTQVAPNSFTFNHYSDDEYWTGDNGFNFSRNFPFEIFIDDVEDLSLRYNCMVEFNGQGVSTSYLTDTSSNGMKGVLVGDYEVRKDGRDIPAMRDSVMSILEIKEDDNGAI